MIEALVQYPRTVSQYPSGIDSDLLDLLIHALESTATGSLFHAVDQGAFRLGTVNTVR